MSQTGPGQAADHAAHEASSMVDVPGTPEMTATDDGAGNLRVLSESTGPTKQVPRPSKIDMPPAGVPGEQDDENRPSTPEMTVADDDQGNYQVVYAGKPPPIEKEEMMRRPRREDGKVELTSRMAPKAVGFGFPTWKKWMILCVVFMVQVSMNFNTSVYPNAVKFIFEDEERFSGVSEQGARVGQMIFLVAYAFGSEVCGIYTCVLRYLHRH